MEIGGLHEPSEVPLGVCVNYVDIMPLDVLRERYPELASKRLVDVDIVDDGERLETIADASPVKVSRTRGRAYEGAPLR